MLLVNRLVQFLEIFRPDLPDFILEFRVRLFVSNLSYQTFRAYRAFRFKHVLFAAVDCLGCAAGLSFAFSMEIVVRNDCENAKTEQAGRSFHFIGLIQSALTLIQSALRLIQSALTCFGAHLDLLWLVFTSPGHDFRCQIQAVRKTILMRYNRPCVQCNCFSKSIHSL